MQDPTKVLLGSTQSSAKDVSRFDSDPASFPAGLAVRVNSSAALSLAKADGMWAGISLGRSLSDTKKTAVARTGERVPLILTDDEDDYSYVVAGTKAYIGDASGQAEAYDSESTEQTISDAMYVAGEDGTLVFDGVKEDGTTVKVALVDMPGGL